MPDWGAANGPNDTRSHAEMIMESTIRKENNPHKDCNCGGTFEKEEYDGAMSIESLQEFRCDNCETLTYDWKPEHKDRQKEELKWENN